jgi:hypothetical protein
MRRRQLQRRGRGRGRRYPGQFDTNYIIFRNVENFKNYLIQIKRYWEGKLGIFRIIPFDEMKISKLINYRVIIIIF